MNTLTALALLFALDAGTFADTASDSMQPEPCGYAPGTLGAPCDGNGECDSTICNGESGERRCAIICFGGCPAGFQCESTGETNLASMCRPDKDTEPCIDDGDVDVNVAEPSPPFWGVTEPFEAAESSPDAGGFRFGSPSVPGATPASDPWDPNGPDRGPYVASEPPPGGCAVGPTSRAPVGLAALLLIVLGLSRRLSMRTEAHPTER
jgi:hypothetical protein